MSLVDQSQQWFPTSVQVTVHQARNLRVKGKNGTNDSYAIMQVAKDKFSTSVAEKSVDPVWKEEASFDLPLFHPGNAERCTLHVIVMHRAQVGLDKFLGQAVVNLLDLHDDRSRTKTDWFKLVDKSGKADKVRGEVLLDMKFMRNNMSASMFDLSMQDKPRSRISKLKDKVRGKKKDGFSDSASAIVPSVSQVLTDSDGEADAQSLNQSPGVKKKSKLKSLFGPKSNLHRNISQSMSTLGALPEKNSSLSGSRSSGLNVDSPEVKKKFKFLGHKRSGSSDSKVSQGPFSLLGRSKQSNSDQNNFCINGNHVYTEETESKSGSTLSLNSSGQGSVGDLHKHTSDASESTDRAILEQQRHQEEGERRQAEESHKAEAKRVEEEEKYRADARRLQEEEERRYQEEQERSRKFLEDESRRTKQREEEEKRKQDEEHRMRQAAENQRLEEERHNSEEQKKQEEASMSDRLSTLFGMIRKKEDKKEEAQQQTKGELPETAPRSDSSSLDQLISHQSTKPFEEIPLSSNESPADLQKSSRNPQTPSAMVFLNRTAKVSAVKPRLVQILESEPPDCQTPSQLYTSPAASDSNLSSVPSEPPDSFSNFHSSLPPPNISKSLSGSPRGSTEDLSSVESEGSSPTMADKKKNAPLLPTYHPHGNQTGGNPTPVREMKSSSYIEADGSQQGKKMSIPLPDYESLFPKKRHGVQGETRWDHIIAEVNQKQRDTAPELLGPEMSVDGPVEHDQSPRSFTSQESPAMRNYQIQPEETRPMSLKKAAAPAPPKQVLSQHPQLIGQNQYTAQQSGMRPNPSAVQGPRNTDLASREVLSGMSREGARKALQPSPAATLAPRPSIQMDTSSPEDQQKEAPTAKPRQRASGKEPTEKEVSAADKKQSNNAQALFSQSVKSMDKKSGQAKANLVEFDPFPRTELLSKDTRAQQKQKQKQEVDNILTGNIRKDPKPEIQGMTANDFEKIFSQDKPTDPFASFSRSNSNNQSPKRKDSEQAGFHAFQRKNSQRRSLTKTLPEDKGLQSQQEAASKEGTTKMAAKQDLVTNDVRKESFALQPQADMKTQSGFYKEEDQFGAEQFALPSALTSSEALQAITEEPGALSGGKTFLQSWVSPSEVQPVSAQNSNGGGQALTARRPHPVKPLTSVESQYATSTKTGKDIKVRDSTPGKIKVADPLESGPYTQLTQGELISLVVRQQTDLSKKDAKIGELEEYIDNLVVRVIEEKPSILQALNAAKQV